MRIYNEDKTQVIENPDLTKGYLKSDMLLISEAQAEEYHFDETVYENGGVERVKVIDKPFKPAEYENIQVYVLYTEKQLKQNRITEIQVILDNLDKDFRQADLGAVFEDLKERKVEFIKLHNELRTLQGKEPRKYN